MTTLVIHDGYNNLLIERDPDGRLRFRIDRAGNPGPTVSVSPSRDPEILDFIQGDR